MSDDRISFENFVGLGLFFYGVCDHHFKLSSADPDDPNALVFEAMESAGDGYRSYLEAVYRRPNDAKDLVFFRKPIALVRIEDASGDFGIFDGWQLVDIEDGHVWLRFGTDNADDYYPYFVFRYFPKKGDE